VSEVVRRDLMHSFDLNPDSVQTIYNGVDLERFKPVSEASARATIRRRLGVPETGPVIVFVGSGFARKGLKFLLRAWPEVGSAATLLVVGNDRSVASYKSMAARLGIAGRVIFVGPMETGAELYSAFDGLVLPSLFEPFGNVVLEAMACGLPVVCSANCGASEIIPEVLAPFVVRDATNPHEIAERIRMLLDQGGDVLSGAARAAAERYTWKRYGSELLAMLHEL
jgi:UDP-glucose:(heptosyl)LPS alpha-1,3-glucosyltransferase